MGRSYRLSRPTADEGARNAARRGGPRLLYLGILAVLVVAAFTVLSMRREWLRRIGESRGQALFELVQDTVPSRPTETPGVVAWLHLELKRYSRHIADPAKARLYSDVTDWHDDESLPPFLGGLRAAMLAPPPRPAAGDEPRQRSSADLGGPPESTQARLQLRVQRYVELHGRWLALTRRRSLDTPDPGDLAAPSNRFLFYAAPHVLAVADGLRATLARQPLPAIPGNRPPRLVRVYAVSEDGTLISAPLAPNAPSAPSPSTTALPPTTANAGAAAALAEGREFRKLPELPNFAPNEFVFRFDFAAPRPRVYYSGLYLDLGGQGMVATLLVPVHDAATGYQAVLAVDLAFDIDWRDFARHIEPPMTAEVVEIGEPATAPWRPWAAMAAHARPDAAADLRTAVTALAATEARAGRPVNPFYLYHGAVEGQGAVAALQVTATTWLVTLYPVTRSSFAFLPAALLAVLVLLLLAGFEASRRRTESAQLDAERALREKQNLLNTMQVPLMVVDPNTDEVVYGNQAAANLGIVSGIRAGDMVVEEGRAREHYARMQTAEHGSRRAYGVPLRVRGEDGQAEDRYALVRSVAVTAPIEALHADQRHRLGVLFLLEPETDLALWSVGLLASTRADERRRLAGLLAHGVDTLARVLAHGLAAEAPPDETQALFNRWLATYLERRLIATAWLLENWDAEPPLPPDCSIEAAQARATIDSFRAVFQRVRAEPRLRSRLHWDNGVLASPPPDSNEVLRVDLDWPDTYWFSAPIRGAFGFFLGEVLINAIRHGRPGSIPSLAITLDPIRRELLFTVDNDLPHDPPPGADRPGESYGGRRLLERLAHLCDWRDLHFDRQGLHFQARWRVPVSERGAPHDAD